MFLPDSRHVSSNSRWECVCVCVCIFTLTIKQWNAFPIRLTNYIKKWYTLYNKDSNKSRVVVAVHLLLLYCWLISHHNVCSWIVSFLCILSWFVKFFFNSLSQSVQLNCFTPLCVHSWFVNKFWNFSSQLVQLNCFTPLCVHTWFVNKF